MHTKSFAGGFRPELIDAIPGSEHGEENSGDGGGPFHTKFSVGGFRPQFINASPGSEHVEENSDDVGGPFHAIQVDQGGHDSALSTELASPALKNTSFAPDQRDEQPPPNESPSGIEIGAEIGGEFVQEELEFDLSGLAKTFLLVSAEESLSTLPENARILLRSAELSSVAGFLLCSGGYILQRSRRTKLAARLMTAAGGVAATCGFILIMGSLLA